MLIRCSILVWLAVVNVVGAQESKLGVDVSSSLAERHAEQQIHQALARYIDVDLRDATLEEIVRFLNSVGVPSRLDVRSLEDAGLGAETAVEFQQSGLPLRWSLDLLLNQLDLTWTIQHGVFLITTPETAEDQTKTVLYDVTSLVIHDGFADFDALIEVIESISPDSWEDVGGAASIREFQLGDQGVLVISQTGPIHETIARFLESLHRDFGTTSKVMPNRYQSRLRTTGTGLRAARRRGENRVTVRTRQSVEAPSWSKPVVYE